MLQLNNATKAKWDQFKKWVGIKEKEGEEKEEEYRDAFSRFQLPIILFLLCIVIFLGQWTDFGTVDVFGWISNLFTNWWAWAILATVILAVPSIIYRDKIFGKLKNPNIGWSWWAFWKIIATIALCIVLWFEVIPWIGSWGIWPKRQHFTQSTGSSPSAPTAYYPAFNTDGSNIMKKGEWKLFTIRRDGPPLYFIHEGTEPVTYRFEKVENRSRSWEVEVYRDAEGKIQERRLTYDEPFPEAQIGQCLVMADRDVIVVVTDKK